MEPSLLQISYPNRTVPKTSTYDLLADILSRNLDFHDKDSRYLSHNFHSFPAKFPPQLPRIFIDALTHAGDVVLDPMMGSGTTVVEAFLSGRRGIGFDIDPLSLKITQTKTSLYDRNTITYTTEKIIENARLRVNREKYLLEERLITLWDTETYKFVNYWFALTTQIELLALRDEIESIEDATVRLFFELAFSAIIITKSGGVSLALDLAHTRPHKAKNIFTSDGAPIAQFFDNTSGKPTGLAKILRSPIDEFYKRAKQNTKSIIESDPAQIGPVVICANAKLIPLKDESIDLIVTSPPYASNAIDYMRAHKFSLVWFGHKIDDLGVKRRDYIGGEALNNLHQEKLPHRTNEVVWRLAERDKRKGGVLYRYYSEMTSVLKEIFRTLKTGKAAIVVVGNSLLCGMDTRIPECLAEIGCNIGFEVPAIGVRNIDRNRRMLPSGTKTNKDSQIQQRMHEEYVIGFFKPEKIVDQERE